MLAAPPRGSLARQAADRALLHALGWWSNLSDSDKQDALLDARGLAIAMAECAIALLPSTALPERALDAGEEAAGTVYGHLLVARERLQD
jgi:hypothetical protein